MYCLFKTPFWKSSSVPIPDSEPCYHRVKCWHQQVTETMDKSKTKLWGQCRTFGCTSICMNLHFWHFGNVQQETCRTHSVSPLNNILMILERFLMCWDHKSQLVTVFALVLDIWMFNLLLRKDFTGKKTPTNDPDAFSVSLSRSSSSLYSLSFILSQCLWWRWDVANALCGLP